MRSYRSPGYLIEWRVRRDQSGGALRTSMLLSRLISTMPTAAVAHSTPLPFAADLVKPYGYPLEEHFVETVDGYILRMFRIPHGRAPQPSQQRQGRTWFKVLRRLYLWLGMPQGLKQADGLHKLVRQDRQRPVVHMQHGLLGSSTDWVLNGPGLSLPLMLADAGGTYCALQQEHVSKHHLIDWFCSVAHCDSSMLCAIKSYSSLKSLLWLVFASCVWGAINQT